MRSALAKLGTTGDVARRPDAALAPRLLEGWCPMPPAEANDPVRTTDHVASPGAAGPGVPADGAARALPDNALTGTYVPGPATGPAGTEPECARGSIAVPGYEIETVLGRGGMGVVYKARHLALKRTVALKMILAGGHAGPSERARFRIEAEAVARLQHPNIVQVFEVGEADGHPYCALEFVEGGNLAGKIAGQPLPARVAARVVEALARGVQLAHSRNVVHRDLKPANILLTSPGRESGELIPKITDFGLARQMDSDSGETQAGAVMGTPSYMAPEQASGRAHVAGPAADIYALGAILYECLTGRPPFKGKTAVETLDQVRTQEPVPPSRRQAGVPPDLETICLKCLHKEPEKRYASAAELADDLVRYQHGEPIRARPVGGIERCVKWVKRNPVVTGAAVIVLLALVVGTTVSYLKYREAADRVKERDAALEKVDAALEESNYQLDSSNFLLAVAAYDSRDVYLARLRLDSIQDKHRGWEWHYLRRQATGGIFTLYGHRGQVNSVAFSPDATRVVTGSRDRTAKVWDARTGTPQLELKGHTQLVMSVAYSPDGTRIVTGSRDQTAKVWDARTGTPQPELKGHTNYVRSWAFSPDGTRIVTGSEDKTAKLWDARTGTPLLDLKGHTGGVSSVAFSPNGGRIVTGSTDKTAKVWDARTGTPLLDLKGHTSGVSSVAFSPDGTRIVTGSYGQRALVWDAQTGTLQLELKGHARGVSSVAFSPDGTRIVTASNVDPAKVWNARTGQELKGEPIPQTIAKNWISPDGRFFAHPYGSLVELVPLQPDEEELSYRRLHTQPNLGRYREGYEAARAAQDDFAARFYLNLLPPLEQKILKAQAAADREIAAGRTADALVYLVTVSAARADDTSLTLRLAGLQAWFDQDKELADTCGRALESARGTFDPTKWAHLARSCCLRPMPDTTRLEAALALARKAVELKKEEFSFQLTLGMAEYRSGHFAQADAALLATAKGAGDYPQVAGTATFYRAMSLFRQGKEDEARKLATEAAVKMEPLPKDEKNPLARGASTDDLMLWLVYKEAKGLIRFDAAPAASEGK
jgi:tetratricopeptide (TPR) repeat protein